MLNLRKLLRFLLVSKLSEYIYTKSCGAAEVVRVIDKSKAVVRFVATGYECEVFRSNIRTGEIKDPTMPVVAGVGFMGVGKHKAKIKGVMTRSYTKWAGMMYRCYGDHSGKNKCYEGVTVCNDWHNYQVFADWFNCNYPDDGKEYHLDKDINGGDAKIYSPESCSFVSAGENIEYSSAKNWVFMSPEGFKFSIYNLKKFCKENGLLECKMSMVSSGARKSHKGWSKWSTKC